MIGYVDPASAGS